MPSHRANLPERVVQQRVIDAPADRIFAALADIRNHPAIDGSGTLTGEPDGPVPLQLGSRFSMGMRQSRVPYRSSNEVVELVADRAIAWRTAAYARGRQLLGGQVWRWELEPRADGTTLVRASFDWSDSLAKPLMIGVLHLDRRALVGLERSLLRLAALVETDPAPDE